MTEKQPESRPKRSMRAAINAMCRQCIYDPHAAGTWRKQVQECTAPDCALYAYRPTSGYREA